MTQLFIQEVLPRDMISGSETKQKNRMQIISSRTKSPSSYQPKPLVWESISLIFAIRFTMECQGQ